MEMTKKQFKYLYGLAYEINGAQPRYAEKVGDLPTVFVRYYGHISQVELVIYESGWSEYNPFAVKEIIELRTDNRFDKDEYNAAVSYLKKLKHDTDAKIKSAQGAATPD